MFQIGCHLSAAKGFAHMAEDALKIGANVFQFFTRNPRGGKAKAVDEGDVAEFLRIAREHGFGPVLAHAPYTLNGCSADPKIREFATNTMIDDMRILEYIPGNLYNFHPGSHVGQGAEAGIEMVAEMLDAVMQRELHTTILLETMAGKGSELGRNFAELRAIIDRAEKGELLGVCLDTCHIFDGGYDIVGNLDGVLEEFDRTLGLGRLRAIHLNDSKNALGSRKDRHEKIGEGNIGLEALARVVNHPLLCELPFYLETPNELEGYGQEIALLKELRQGCARTKND